MNSPRLEHRGCGKAAWLPREQLFCRYVSIKFTSSKRKWWWLVSHSITSEKNVPSWLREWLKTRGRVWGRETSSPPFYFLVSANIKLSFFIDEAEPWISLLFNPPGAKTRLTDVRRLWPRAHIFLLRHFSIKKKGRKKKWLIKEMVLQIYIFFYTVQTLWNDFVKLNLISRTASPQTVIHLVSLRCWQYDIINLLRAFYCCYIFTFGLHGDHEISFSALTISQLSSKCGRVGVRVEVHFHTFHMSKS